MTCWSRGLASAPRSRFFCLLFQRPLNLQKYPPPHNWLIIAGAIDTTTNYIEHPQVVADRIECVAMAIGDPRRVLAGTDCGFGTAAGFGECAPGVVWEKLRALRAGADIAGARLFG